MKLRRRRGLGGGRDRGERERAAGEEAGIASGRDARGSGGRDPLPVRAGRWLWSPGGRWARVTLVVFACFVAGYLIAATWLFPAPDGAAPVELVQVPDLRGASLEAAGERAADRGLELAAIAEIHHPEAEVGDVIAQSPLPGQGAAGGDTLRITTSLGPRTARVPSLRGLSEGQARAILERLGFTVEARTVEAAAPGVHGTEPEAGTRVGLPAEVELRVGEGARVVAVPDLRGMHIEDVESLLEEAGLQLGSVRYDPDAAQAPGRIVAQSPPAGYSLRGGGLVSVEVAGPPRGG